VRLSGRREFRFGGRGGRLARVEKADKNKVERSYYWLTTPRGWRVS